MSFDTTVDRWRAAATTAATSTLADRWRITTRQWLEAKAEYLALYEAEVTNVSALRKAAQRLHDLGQLRKVLAGSPGLVTHERAVVQLAKVAPFAGGNGADV